MMAKKHLPKEASIEMQKSPATEGENGNKNNKKNDPKRKSESFEQNRERSPKRTKDDSGVERTLYQPIR